MQTEKEFNSLFKFIILEGALFMLFVSAYYAQVAGLYYGINNTDTGFQVAFYLAFSGF